MIETKYLRNIFIIDHLGNVRIIVDEDKKVLEKNNYYPYGLVITADNIQIGNRKKYNGKESITELDLDWYDYGARFYDATIGRFFTQDKFAEKYIDITPYQYGANNPIKYIDINGDSIIQVNINDKSGFIHGDKILNIDHTILEDVESILQTASNTETHIHINSSFRTNKKQESYTNKENKDILLLLLNQEIVHIMLA